ncbi:Trihelix transcription factor GT-3b [Ancistrocladus abbreviatus]
MEGHMHHRHHHHHHPLQQQQQQQQPQPQQQQMMSSVDAGERFPQWSLQETREFLMIRAELDRSFMETKRNKLLWELISTKMKEKGFNRSAEQCKCKWKNLVTRYKACETMEPAEAMRQQFPFYNEMQAIFTTRMERMLWAEEAEGAAASGSKKKQAATQLSSDDEDDEDTDDGGELQKISTASRKKKKKAKRGGSTSAGTAGGGGNVNSLKEILEEFMKQQVQMELQWREAWEAREEERRRREMEWRQKMEALENERLMMERRWREWEEQRRIREEARAERRDALINALLEKLRREQDI